MRRKAGLLVILIWTYCLSVYHLGVLTPPNVGEGHATAEWIDKAKFGMHQLVLRGDAYGRGLKSGELTKSLMRTEEVDLTTKLFSMIPRPVVLASEIPLIRYFWGIQNSIDPWMLEEMYGTSKSADPEFNYLIDPFTRQLAYHGLHEVGQMMVDQGGDAMGCSVIAVPFKNSWVLGRNFDFEGGRILDQEKILKWVFPDNGYAFVSVIWAGMVGGVTAVNEHGLYLSINAAGSTDRRRFGMPTTLLLVKTMMNAKNAAEALAILKKEPTFITDIFVLLDSKSGEMFRIEKSPLNTEVFSMKGPFAVINHLLADRFKNDRINVFRRERLTSMARADRAEQLLKNPKLLSVKSSQELEPMVLSMIRDKGDGLPLGHRSAIDATIATHAVVYNSDENVLFVSKGPALVGGFQGFDLKASFAQKTPVAIRTLPHDTVSDETYNSIHDSWAQIEEAQHFLHSRDCDKTAAALERVSFKESSGYYHTKGDYADHCQKDLTQARADWEKALALKPAYISETETLKKNLARK